MLLSGCLLLIITSSFILGRRSSEEQNGKAKLVPIEASVDSLVYVHAVWRHGDRTPAYSVPFNDVSTWEEGLGELTKKGIAQQYRLGKWLRARYYNWLGQRFHRSEVFVRSSDYNRTLMSAQANMAGLFPPSKSEIWDDKLDWQPVPIHSVPKVIDKELYEDIDCPTASSEFLRVKKSEVVRQMERENEDLIKYLGENSKIPNFDIDKLRVVYDNIFCMSQHNDSHKWPTWMNTSIFDRMRNIYNTFSRMKYHTNVLRRLRGGPLLKDILNRFAAKSNGTLGHKPKFFAYSAHDTTVAALLATLGIFPQVFPLYTSTVLLELHRRGGQYIVEVFHKNETDVDKLYNYEIPGCGDPCTLDTLQVTMKQFIPTDWMKECGLDGPNVTNYIISTIVFACTTVFLTAILVMDIFLRRKRRSSLLNDRLISEEES